MELDLEEQWNKAFEAKRTGRIDAGRPVKGMELLWKVTDPSYVGTAAENWNERIVKAIRLEKAEAAKKYNIVFGQTEIYCARCGKSCWPGRHVCEDMRFENLYKARKVKAEEKIKITKKIKADKEKAKSQTPLLCAKIKDIGRKKVAIKLELSKNTINHWIKRESIPFKYIQKVMEL